VTKRRTPGPPRRYWSASDIRSLTRLYPERPTAEVATRLKRGRAAIYGMAKKLGLQKSEKFNSSDLSGRIRKGHAERGERTRFVKGQTPANKGLRRPGYSVGRGRMRETQFSKGDRPRNWQPVGSIRTNSDGYLEVKVREGIWNPRQGQAWKLLHRELWKREKGPIPPTHIVVFKDHNSKNCTIDNLELISKADNARRNAMWNRYPPELSSAIMLNGALKRKIRSKANGKEQDRRPAGPPVRDA
jgi:hypothetical protein